MTPAGPQGDGGQAEDTDQPPQEKPQEGTGTGPRIPSTVAAGPPPEGTSPLCASSRPSSPATGASQDGVNPSCPGVVRTAAWGRNDGSKSGQRHRQRAPRRRPALS
ncbi:salivary acidic proline-rich phosphoprotein 1/2-like isoform X2 [Emydura macquarii macquarii]|uniref:salivary acidic proline-rich phosphoprotein 1/2-like isoform X2 n=1 Tax=Emydura macquarii macquarii TaxID=1129001 RepID=UPI003529F6E1